MEARSLLDRMQEFFMGGGTAASGWECSEEEAIAVATARYPGHSYCTVHGWTLLMIGVTEQKRDELRNMGFEPCVLTASSVITDSTGRFARGRPVHTSLQRAYDEDGIFLSRNTLYVLLGEGRVKQIDDDLHRFLLIRAKVGLLNRPGFSGGSLV